MMATMMMARARHVVGDVSIVITDEWEISNESMYCRAAGSE